MASRTKSSAKKDK
jgi:SAM-dependent methyltransferase